MGRKTIELEIGPADIGDKLKKGDIIVGAEELGTVVSARPTIHNNGTAFVYFMGGDCYKEIFGIPQEGERPVHLTVLRDPSGEEFEWSGRPIGTHVMVEISKVGGGRVGRRYTGRWAYRATQNNKVVAEGDDLDIKRNVTHEEAARMAWCFLDSEYDEVHGEGEKDG